VTGPLGVPCTFTVRISLLPIVRDTEPHEADVPPVIGHDADPIVTLVIPPVTETGTVVVKRVAAITTPMKSTSGIRRRSNGFLLLCCGLKLICLGLS